jgi:flagellar biosynthesis/type III secretory pathway M-ring protein FliF/YscJ
MACVVVLGIGSPEHQPNGLIAIILGAVGLLAFLAVWTVIFVFSLRFQARMFRLQRELASSAGDPEAEDSRRQVSDEEE